MTDGRMPIELTHKQKAALRGELSEQDFAAEGMGLFKAGMVSIDPLKSPDDPSSYHLTQLGREAAIELRSEPPESGDE